MDILLVAYKDMILSITQGYWEGRVSISKPIYMLAILDAIERNVLISNKIELNDVYIRNKFGEFYKQYNGNEKGYLAAFFIRPYYHLNTAPFYHLHHLQGIFKSIFYMRSWMMSCGSSCRMLNTENSFVRV